MFRQISWSLLVALALSPAAAQGDIIVKADGHAFGGKVLSQNDKEVVVIPDNCDASATDHLPRSLAARVLTTDEHGAIITDSAAPAIQDSAPQVSPADPAAPPILPPGKAPTYYVIPLHGEVGETVLASALEKSLADAVARQPTVVVLDIDSPGGLVNEAQQIIKILHKYNKKLRIVALTEQDLSAAAISTLSVREIYVKSSSTIGAATSFMPSHMILPPKIEEKMQSAWRAEARNSAEEGHHEPLLADAMIDNDRELHWELVNGKPVVKDGPGEHTLCRKGKILTLTSHEAVACGLASGDADDFDELGDALKLGKWTEIKGLGTLLADVLPQRVKTYESEIEKIRLRFVKDAEAAEKSDPTQSVTTVTRVVNTPQIPSRPQVPRPGIPMQRPGIPNPTQVITQTRARPTSAWKSDSLECVLALQQMEGDLKDAMALATAYGRTSEAAMMSETLEKISAVRASTYEDRDKYVKTIFGPGVLKTGEVGSKGGTGYIVTNGRDPQLIGLRCTLRNSGPKQTINAIEPLFAKPTTDTPKGAVDLLAKDGYAVGGLLVSANADNVLAVRLIFMATNDGRLVPSETYRSDWAGQEDTSHDPVLVAGKGPAVVGFCGRKNTAGSLVAIGLLLKYPEKK